MTRPRSMPIAAAAAPVPLGTPAPAHADEVTEVETSADSQVLERIGSVVTRTAEFNGVDIEFLGVEPLFDTARLYHDTSKRWVVCPAAEDPLVKAGLPIPARHHRKLERLIDIGLDFPHLYLAHELAPGTAVPTSLGDDDHVELDDATVKRLVTRPDAPAPTRRTAERIENTTRVIVRGAGRVAASAAIGVGAALASPLLLLDGLDPGMLGAVTAPGTGSAPGTAAAWFLLARWDW